VAGKDRPSTPEAEHARLGQRAGLLLED
jgi:hypothetical protein